MEIDMREFLNKTEEEKIELLRAQKGTVHLTPNQVIGLGVFLCMYVPRGTIECRIIIRLKIGDGATIIILYPLEIECGPGW